MEIYDISLLVIILGLVGYIWKLRNVIVKLIPGEKDDKILDTLEGILETLGLDIDEAAKKSRGKLRERLREELK